MEKLDELEKWINKMTKKYKVIQLIERFKEPSYYTEGRIDMCKELLDKIEDLKKSC